MTVINDGSIVAAAAAYIKKKLTQLETNFPSLPLSVSHKFLSQSL